MCATAKTAGRILVEQNQECQRAFAVVAPIIKLAAPQPHAQPRISIPLIIIANHRTPKCGTEKVQDQDSTWPFTRSTI